MRKIYFLVVILSLVVFLNGCLSSDSSSSSPIVSSDVKIVDNPIMSVADLNKTIEESKADWQAFDNPAAAFIKSNPSDSSLFGCALETPSADAINRAPLWPVQASMPDKVDWTTKGVITPARDQGKFNTCVAFASIGALEAQERIFFNNPAMTTDYSELNLFAQGGNYKLGWAIGGAVSVLKSRGVIPESACPYSFTPTMNIIEVAPAYRKIRCYTSLLGSPQIKQALQKGPVIAGMYVYQDFMYYRSGIYRYLRGARLGGHAILIVGYNEQEKVWICKNSWGQQWGENGFFKIQYGNCGIETFTSYGIEVEEPSKDIPIPTPSIIALTARTSTTLTFTFTASPGVDGYRVYDGSKVIATVPVGQSTCYLTNLKPITYYQIFVSAYIGTREGLKSPYKLFSTTNNPVPVNK